MTKGMRWNRRHQLRLLASLLLPVCFLSYYRHDNVFSSCSIPAGMIGRQCFVLKMNPLRPPISTITLLQTKHQIQFSLLTERIIYHLCHREYPDSCIRFGFWIMETISFITFIIHKLSTYMNLLFFISTSDQVKLIVSAFVNIRLKICFFLQKHRQFLAMLLQIIISFSHSASMTLLFISHKENIIHFPDDLYSSAAIDIHFINNLVQHVLLSKTVMSAYHSALPVFAPCFSIFSGLLQFQFLQSPEYTDQFHKQCVLLFISSSWDILVFRKTSHSCNQNIISSFLDDRRFFLPRQSRELSSSIGCFKPHFSSFQIIWYKPNHVSGTGKTVSSNSTLSILLCWNTLGSPVTVCFVDSDTIYQIPLSPTVYHMMDTSKLHDFFLWFVWTFFFEMPSHSRLCKIIPSDTIGSLCSFYNKSNPLCLFLASLVLPVTATLFYLHSFSQIDLIFNMSENGFVCDHSFFFFLYLTKIRKLFPAHQSFIISFR